ncbi:hypothetical protein ABZ357_13690 [Streptomyces sp. NPDC005917]|uniref:hypothetical protein n=1 Tax=unclassified Streptomyces TaxID=2593676 RepID=UPI0033F0EC2F
MGDRMNGDGVSGRRREHPGGTESGPLDARDAAALESVLATALREGVQDHEAEQRALTAFRAARDTGARTRRRDDWRLPAERRAGRSVKMTFGVVFASLTLGGVAVAAIGSAGSSTNGAGDGPGTAHPAAAPARPGGAAPSTTSGGPGTVGGPARAQDTEAHCRAYEQVKGHGKALEATAWQRLVTAAGGKDRVAAYCSEQLASATAAPGKSGSTGKPGVGNGSTATKNAIGNGRASGGKGNGKIK